MIQISYDKYNPDQKKANFNTSFPEYIELSNNNILNISQDELLQFHLHEPLPEYIEWNENKINSETTELSNNVFPKIERASDLMKKNLPEQKWLLPEIIPDSGYIMLAGAPKDGKSYFCTQFISTLLTGGNMFGHNLEKLEPNSILYFDLENSERTRQTRLKQFFPNGIGETDFIYISEAYPIIGSPSFIDQLDFYRSQLPNLKIVIIDMYKHIQTPRSTGETQNQHESKELKALGDYFKDSGLLAILINHTIKDSLNNSDPFQIALGTAGSLGAFDELITITKEINPYTKKVEKRQIHVKGRDVEEKHFDVDFIGEWILLGDSENNAVQTHREGLLKNTTIKAIIQLVDENNGKWIGSSKDILRKKAIIENIPVEVFSNQSKQLALEVANLKDILLNDFSIKYEPKKNKGSSIKHQFYKVGVLEDSDFIEIPEQKQFI